MGNAQAGFTASYPHMLNEQAKHLAYIIRRGLDAGASTIEVTADAEKAWIEQCLQKARQTGDFFENCTPGYYNNEGRPGERTAQDGFYGGGSPAFFTLLEAWRSEGTMPGLVVTPARV
jgi:cyclohexanone monooxygenase